MRKKWIKNGKFILLILLLLSTLGYICHDKPTDNQTPSDECGVGTGDYEFYVVNSVPDSFDCNDSGRFVITLLFDASGIGIPEAEASAIPIADASEICIWSLQKPPKVRLTSI
ncbi:MAG: hypothetical protein ACE5KJ_03290 [Candidatus Zixiibacteriota bacterium]